MSKEASTHAAPSLLLFTQSNTNFVQRVRSAVLLPGHKHVAEVPVQVCKRLEVPFRVTSREACNVSSGSREISAATRQQLQRTALLLEVENVGIFLLPLDGAIRPVHADTETILFADGHLRRPVVPRRSTLVLQEYIRVVVERTSLDERLEAGCQLVDLQSCNEVHQVLDVRADVANTAGHTGILRVRPPDGLTVGARAFDGVGQPVLRVFCSHDAERPESPGSDEVAGFAHHGVASVGIGHHELDLVRNGKCDQLLRLFLGKRHRLFTDDVDALFEECLGHRKVDVVGDSDDDEVNPALRACSFLDGHFMEISIRAVSVDTKLLRDLDRLRREVRKTPGNQLRLIVHCDSGAMHWADERSWSSAYLPIQEAGSCIVQLAFDHVTSPFPEESICACTGPSPIGTTDGIPHTTVYTAGLSTDLAGSSRSV